MFVRFLRNAESIVALCKGNVVERNEYVLFMKNEIRVVDGETDLGKKQIKTVFNIEFGICLDFGGGFSKLFVISDDLTWVLISKRQKYFETCISGVFSRQNDDQTPHRNESIHYILNRISATEIIIIFSIFRGSFDVLTIKFEPFRSKFVFSYLIHHHTLSQVRSMNRLGHMNFFSVVHHDREETSLEVFEIEIMDQTKDVKIKPGPFRIAQFGEYDKVIPLLDKGMLCVSKRHGNISEINWSKLMHIEERIVVDFRRNIPNLQSLHELSSSSVLFFEADGKSHIFNVESKNFKKSINFYSDLVQGYSEPPILLKSLGRDIKNEIWKLYVSFPLEDFILTICNDRLLSKKLFRQKIGEISNFFPTPQSSSSFFMMHEARSKKSKELKSVEFGIERKTLGDIFSPTRHCQIDDFFVVQTLKEKKSTFDAMSNEKLMLLLIHKTRNSTSVMHKNRVTKNFPFLVSQIDFIGSEYFLCLNSSDGTLMVMKKYITRLEIVIPKVEISSDNNVEEKALKFCVFNDHEIQKSQILVLTSASNMIFFTFSRRALRKEKVVVWKGSIESIEHANFSHDGKMLILLQTRRRRRRRRILLLTIPTMKLVSTVEEDILDDISQSEEIEKMYLLSPHWIIVVSSGKIIRLRLLIEDESSCKLERMEEWNFGYNFDCFHLKSQNRIWIFEKKGGKGENIIIPSNELLWGIESSFILKSEEVGRKKRKEQQHIIMNLQSIDDNSTFLALLEDPKTSKRGFQYLHFDEERSLFFEGVMKNDNNISTMNPVSVLFLSSESEEEEETLFLFSKSVFNFSRNKVLFQPIRTEEEEFVDFVYFKKHQLLIVYSIVCGNNNNNEEEEEEEIHLLYFLKYDHRDGVEFYDSLFLDELFDGPIYNNRSLAKMEVVDYMDSILLIYEENCETVVIEISRIEEKRVVFSSRSYLQQQKNMKKRCVSLSVLKDTCFIISGSEEEEEEEVVIVYSLKKDRDLEVFTKFSSSDLRSTVDGVHVSYMSEEGDLIFVTNRGQLFHIPLLQHTVMSPKKRNGNQEKKRGVISTFQLGNTIYREQVNVLQPTTRTTTRTGRVSSSLVFVTSDGAIGKLTILKDERRWRLLKFIFQTIVQSPVFMESNYLLDNQLLRNVGRMGRDQGFFSDIVRLFLTLDRKKQLRILGDFGDTQKLDTVIDVIKNL